MMPSRTQAQLTASAKAEINKMLTLEPGETSASISTRADEQRNPATAAGHYINFPKNSCTDDTQLAVLAADAAAAKRLAALKYVVRGWLEPVP